MEVKLEDVDGVTTLYVDEGVIPGPVRGCLMFGVGRCDETLIVSGINHSSSTLRCSTPTATSARTDT